MSISAYKTFRRGSADAIAASLPTDVAAMHIDPRVVETLGRWRHVNTHSLHSLASALTTGSGDLAAHNAHYLSALHGFVAERITADHLGVILPSVTNVPGVDLHFHGQSVQVKEGSTAYDLVHHALDRYPSIRTFATDPATAERLQAEGISAIPIHGLEPTHVADITANSMHGLGALEIAGAITFPCITTAVSICRYWDLYDSGRSDGFSALQNAATDVCAQAIGTAVGLKLGAIAAVTSPFALAAVPLTAGAIAGALGLRMLVGQYRQNKVAILLEQFDDVRFAAEQASNIAVELSREDIERLIVDMAGKHHSTTEAEVKLELVTSYISLLDQLITIARPVTEALDKVVAEAERLGVKVENA